MYKCTIYAVLAWRKYLSVLSLDRALFSWPIDLFLITESVFSYIIWSDKITKRILCDHTKKYTWHKLRVIRDNGVDGKVGDNFAHRLVSNLHRLCVKRIDTNLSSSFFACVILHPLYKRKAVAAKEPQLLRTHKVARLWVLNYRATTPGVLPVLQASTSNMGFCYRSFSTVSDSWR